MSGHLKQFDEDLDNPFDLMAQLGWHTSEQDHDDLDYDFDDDDDWDDDVYLASAWLFEFRVGDWGQFNHGLTWDGSPDFSDVESSDEMSGYEHVHLVMDMRRAERQISQF